MKSLSIIGVVLNFIGILIAFYFLVLGTNIQVTILDIIDVPVLEKLVNYFDETDVIIKYILVLLIFSLGYSVTLCVSAFSNKQE